MYLQKVINKKTYFFGTDLDPLVRATDPDPYQNVTDLDR